MPRLPYELVVIGASAGGFHALKALLLPLPADFCLPIVAVQHVTATSDGSWLQLLADRCQLPVVEAEEKAAILPGALYVAPANYHLLIEQDRHFSLSTEERVNFARPAIDVLFETAADAYDRHLIGIVLTGANADGAAGLQAIGARGGLTLVQDPDTAEARTMPEAAIRAASPDRVLSPQAIGELLYQLHQTQRMIEKP